MNRYVIKIRYCDDNYYWSDDTWKENVCADFDENVVIIGNRNTEGIEEATWWTEAKSVFNELDNYAGDRGAFISVFEDEYAIDKLADIYDAYDLWDGRDVPAFTAKIAETLFPGLSIKFGTIRGASQGDWADVVYLEDAIEDIDILEAWYYGDVYDVQVYDVTDVDPEILDDEYELRDYISDDDWIDMRTIAYPELWELQRDPAGKEQAFIKEFGLPEDSEIYFDED